MGLEETRIFEIYFSDLTYESQGRYLNTLGYSRDDMDNMLLSPIAVVMHDTSENLTEDIDPDDMGREITVFSEEELNG